MVERTSVGRDSESEPERGRPGQDEPDVTQVGAPALTPRPPDPASAGGRFNAWLGHRHTFVENLLEQLTTRWDPLGSFIELHFHDPNWGMCGALVSLNADTTGQEVRERLVSAIPFSEMVPFIPVWRRGDTVLVHVDDMPSALARRYHATHVHWSLNVPIFVEEEWVGLIGAATGSDGVGDEMVASYESSAHLLSREYAADAEWQRFRNDMTEPGIMTLWGSDGRQDR